MPPKRNIVPAKGDNNCVIAMETRRIKRVPIFSIAHRTSQDGVTIKPEGEVVLS
jgi:hypothetical protein